MDNRLHNWNGEMDLKTWNKLEKLHHQKRNEDTPEIIYLNSSLDKSETKEIYHM